MSPVYLNPHQSSSIPFLDLKDDQQHNLPTIVGYVHDHVTNTSTNNSYFSGSNFRYHHTSTEFLAMDYSRCTQEKVVEKLILSHDHKPIVYPFDHSQDEGDHNIKIIKNNYENPKKCKPTKLKIMHKAASTTEEWKNIAGDNKGNHDHHLGQPQQNSNIYRKTRNETNINCNNNNNNGIRMCTDCHTTTTPLWRSGPQGPKSLCNACGIRQRKARKAAAAVAMAAAQAQAQAQAQATEVAMGGSESSSPMSSTTFEAPKVIIDEEMSRSKVKLDHDYNISSHTLPLKKRSKIFNSSWSYNNNNISTNNNDINNITNDNSSKRVFPRDEEEGAILLMALSCGLAWS